MRILTALVVTLLMLVTIGLHPVSKGVKGGAPRELIHMNRLSNTLSGADSGSDGVVRPSFDRGHDSWFG